LLCWHLIDRCTIFFFFQAEDGIRDRNVTGVQTCALPIFRDSFHQPPDRSRRPHGRCGGHLVGDRGTPCVRTGPVSGGAKKGEWRRRTPRRGSAAPPLPSEDVRRRPTLPHPPECSTIGAIELSFRVRNGTGRFLDAMTAVTRRDPTSPQHTPLTRHMPGVVPREPHSGRK